jgi:hypothetical protein
MDRRFFLKLVPTAGPGALAFTQIVRPATLDEAGGIAPSNGLYFGLIDADGQGRLDVGKFRGINDVKIIGVCDPDRVHREKSVQQVESRYPSRHDTDNYQGSCGYTDDEELLERAVITAARAGTHVLLKAGLQQPCRVLGDGDLHGALRNRLPSRHRIGPQRTPRENHPMTLGLPGGKTVEKKPCPCRRAHAPNELHSWF